ncbi:MAG: hypothetical protein RR744_08705 [Cellulosilyticaceae bacterium]
MIRMEIADKRKMENYLNTYVRYDFNKGIDWLEKDWAEAKSHHLFKLMGGELILEKEIEVVKPQEEISNLLYGAFDILSYEINGHINRKYKEVPYEDYYNIDRAYQVIVRGLGGNALKQEGSLNIDGKKIVFSKGQKPLKALSTFLKATGIDVAESFESFRLEHSRILNDSKLRGTLCLSIHPLDYVTLSDNDCGWESCFSIKEEGCYQAATLELLNCPSTIVAYLKSSRDMLLCCGENSTWNSKRWRQLIVAQDDVAIMSNKGYPYRSDEMSKIALDWIKELAEKNCGYTYSKELFNYDDYLKIGGTRELIFTTELCYNDIEADNNAHARYYKGNGFKTTGSDCYLNEIKMGGRAYCLACGCIIDDAEELACSDCLGRENCSCCGDMENRDDMKELTNGDLVCDYCFHHHIVHCDRCHEDYHTDTMHYHNEEALCQYCYDICSEEEE